MHKEINTAACPVIIRYNTSREGCAGGNMNPLYKD